jgi:propionyl-CoA synthetase
MIANSLGIENACEIRFSHKAVCGYDIRIFNENGDELKPMKVWLL